MAEQVLVTVGYTALAVGNLRQATQLIELLGGMTLVDRVCLPKAMRTQLRGDAVAPNNDSVTVSRHIHVLSADDAQKMRQEYLDERSAEQEAAQSAQTVDPTV